MIDRASTASLERMRLAPAIVCLSAVLLLVLPATAPAGDALHVPGSTELRYGGTSDDEDVTITRNGMNYDIVDPSGVDELGDCTDTGPTSASCPAANVTFLIITLDAGDDAATLNLDDVTTPQVESFVTSLVLAADGDDTLVGGPGADELVGDDGIDTLRGRDGDDELVEQTSTDGAANTLDGGAGNDTLSGGDGPETFDGGPDDDTVDGNGGVDQVMGGDGADTLSGGDADDTLSGGPGNDQLGFTFRQNGLPSEAGNDTLDGGDGDDLLTPGFGPEGGVPDADALNGGPGRDTSSFDLREQPVEVSLDAAGNDGFPGEGDNVGNDVERVVGGQSDDALRGSSRGETLDGNRGSDLIEGAEGDDELDGGAADAGNDVINGGDGADRLLGATGNDQLAGQAGADSVEGGGDADDLSGGGEADTLEGGAGDDALGGGAGNDMLDGGAPALVGQDGSDDLRGEEGDDGLSGGDGNDELVGGAGSDAMSGGTGVDAASYATAGRAVTVTLNGRADDGERGEADDVETDVEDVQGGGVNDTFTGSGDANRLDGGDGEDFVDGRAGIDNLRGDTAIDVVRARDGRADTVDCGRSRDFAIVDPRDTTENCEEVENGRRTRPALGRAAVIQPLRGESEFGPVRMRRTVPLDDELRVALLSKVDATDGTVRMETAVRGDRRQVADFSRGAFRIQRSRGRFANLRLVGDLDCGQARVVRDGGRARPARRVRRLRGSSRRGRYRTRTRHSSTVTRGTVWEVVERCNGTLTIVRRGTVRVRDFARRRTVTLRRGERYFARARRG